MIHCGEQLKRERRAVDVGLLGVTELGELYFFLYLSMNSCYMSSCMMYLFKSMMNLCVGGSDTRIV